MSDLLNSASLVLIPSGYKEDIVYSAVPTDGSGDLSFTRASNGTRINSAGLVEVCPWNIVQQSETFNTGWSLYANATITSNSQTAPNGTLTADTLNSSTLAYSGIYQGLGTLPTNVYTYSIYVKADTNSFIYMLGQGNGSQIAFFNLSTGVVTSTSNLDSASIESVGNGWFRCQIQKTGAGIEMFVGSSNIANITPTASGTVFIWGAQTNIGATAKPYFPTTDRLNVPRLTYQNGGGGCPSLLLEKQSTNETNYSEQFDNAYWSKNNQSVTANATISPDGTQNADLLIPSAGAVDHYILSNTVSNASGQVVTLSMFVKKKDNDYFSFGCGGASSFGAVVYRFSTNTFTVGGLSATATNFGNGWIRLSITGTTTSTDLRLLFTPTDSSGSRSYNANGTDGTYIWGAQAESGSYPTSYIPTTSASATRVADACFKTGISSLIGTDFTIFFDGYETTGGDSSRYVVLKGTGGTYVNFISMESNTNQRISIAVNDGAGGGVFSAISGSLTNGQRVKIALRCKNNDFAFYVNGSLISSQASGSVPTTADLYLGYYTDYNDNYNVVNQFAIFNQTLTNAELASLTTL